MSKRKIRTPGVYHDSSGTYYLKYKNKTYRGFKTVEDAEIKKAQLKLEPDIVKNAKFSVVVLDYLNDQLARVESEEITYGTYKKKESTFRLYVLPTFGNVRLNKITPKNLRNFRNDLNTINKSSRTKNRIIEVVKSVFTYANKYYGYDKDPSIYLENFPKTSIEKKKEKLRLNYIWNDSDFERFTDGMDLNYRFVFVMMFKHGLRLGEAQALRYIDVDFKNKIIDINGSITHKSEKGPFERKETKNESSKRKLFIGSSIDLISELKSYNSKYYQFDKKWFICGNKIPLSQKKIQRYREKHIKISKVPEATNHEMRHMFVTNTWSAGVPITAISNYIGHKNISVTLNTYSHLTQIDDSKMDEYIKSSIKKGTSID